MYDTEMAGLMMGAKMAASFITRQPEIMKIVFCVDNSAAAGAVFNPKPNLCQLYVARFHHKMTKFLNNDPPPSQLKLHGA